MFILGTDGTGKSAVLRELERTWPSDVPVRFGVRHPGSVYRSRIGDREHPGEHYTRPLHGPVRSVLKMAVLAFDWRLGDWRTRRSGAEIVIMARHYFLDVLVDPHRYRYGGPARIVRWLMGTLPSPDLVVLLDADPEVIRARKAELPPEEIARQRKKYLDMVRELPYGWVLDTTSRPLEEVVTEVRSLILNPRARERGRTR